MARYKMIVQLDAAEGVEEEFLENYPNVHIQDMLKVLVVQGAEFLRRGHAISDAGPHR